MSEPKKKILIVTGDVALLQQLFRMTCDEFEVVSAVDLSTARRRATVYEPNVLVINPHLGADSDAPRGGAAFIEWARQNLPRVKVLLVLPGGGGQGNAEAGCRADDTVFIPFEPSAFMSALRGLASG